MSAQEHINSARAALTKAYEDDWNLGNTRGYMVTANQFTTILNALNALEKLHSGTPDNHENVTVSNLTAEKLECERRLRSFELSAPLLDGHAATNNNLSAADLRRRIRRLEKAIAAADALGGLFRPSTHGSDTSGSYSVTGANTPSSN
jgi:hypothetical protein